MIIDIPAMLDPHVHLRDMDWAHKSTFESETAAAIAGGYWAVLDMPNTPPSTTTRAALDIKLARIESGARCDWGVYFGASQPAQTDEFTTSKDDVCGIKLYNNATTGNLLITDQAVREHIYQKWDMRTPIAVHAEGKTVAQLLDLVRQYRRFTHFCHISTREEIEMLRAAKEDGLPVSIGVTPHHLLLTDEDISTLGAFGLMKPELKTADDVKALWQALADGVVDIIESDHAPHTRAEKESDKPPFGVPGLETTLAIMITAAHEGRITIEQVVSLLADNPRRIFGLQAPAETFTRVAIDAAYTIDSAKLYSRAGWTPFDGMRVYGRVLEVWSRGHRVYDGEQVLATAGHGRNIGREVDVRHA